LSKIYELYGHRLDRWNSKAEHNMSRDNPGRRPFPRSERHFEMLTMGYAVVVSSLSGMKKTHVC